MGIGKFWIKHGPGSPGSIAKAVAKDYVKWKREFPKVPRTQLLRKTLSTRMVSYTMLGLSHLSEVEQAELLKNRIAS